MTPISRSNDGNHINGDVNGLVAKIGDLGPGNSLWLPGVSRFRRRVQRLTMQRIDYGRRLARSDCNPDRIIARATGSVRRHCIATGNRPPEGGATGLELITS